MVKESSRKCSHCGHNGHNVRRCNGGGCIKLFGVRIPKENVSIRKSKSTGDLANFNAEVAGVDAGYLSDGPIGSEKAKAAHERKRGNPWSEEEHQLFLLGLENLGKGDWKGISTNYVPSRTPTQVASHAQKYFIRITATDRRKCRSSLFDMPLKESAAARPPLSPVGPYKTKTEILQPGNASPVSPLKINIENQSQVAKAPDLPQGLPVAAAYGVSDFRHMQYMAGISGQSFPEGAKVMPTLCFIPIMNNPNQNYLHHPTATATPQLQPPRESSQAGSGSPITKKDGQELSIGVA